MKTVRQKKDVTINVYINRPLFNWLTFIPTPKKKLFLFFADSFFFSPIEVKWRNKNLTPAAKPTTFVRNLFHERMNDRLCIECLQIGIRLSSAHKNDRLSGNVRHRYGSADLIVNGIEFRQHNAVDDVRIRIG